MADYEKQFQEDLERAQALSLESLALEQFKTKKLQELNRSATTINVSTRPKLTSVTRAASMNETDSGQIRYDRQQSKSRPRPGVQSSSGNSLLAPPPSSQRKNSTSNDPDTPDLISFSSPPATTSTSNDIIDFCKQQNYNQQLVLSSSMLQQQPSHFKFWPQMAMTPPTPTFASNIPHPPQGLIYPNGSYYPPINRVQYSLNNTNSPVVPPTPWTSASTPSSINARTPSSVGSQLSSAASTPNSGISTPVQQHSPSPNIGSSLHRPSSIPQMQVRIYADLFVRSQ
ncbi:unnamed protein product [Diabrotica balteata]|uniref:Uncharacterized protein n=1 Tax=Diabrotica balteata TaxID=107213 RepID=A0A9N9XFE9_DIABA|nr:unnamed protein product [Diabrotica balteata]